MSLTRSSGTSESYITIREPPRAFNMASTMPTPKRASRSRCSTTSVWTEGSPRSFNNLGRRSFRPLATSETTLSRRMPLPARVGPQAVCLVLQAEVSAHGC